MLQCFFCCQAVTCSQLKQLAPHQLLSSISLHAGTWNSKYHFICTRRGVSSTDTDSSFDQTMKMAAIAKGKQERPGFH